MWQQGSQAFPTGYGSMVPAQEKLKVQVSVRNLFLVCGLVVTMLLCIVPIWNAFALMEDVNYNFWVGSALPKWIIFVCFAINVLYIISILLFFRHAHPEVQTEQTVMMLANVFITLTGLALMLLSLPVSSQSQETYNNLMHRCDYSEQTHRMYEYSQVLQNIRATPACAKKYSVEECVGYATAEPYTSFLKTMEEIYHCSGFCYRSPQQLQVSLQSVNQTSNRNDQLASSAVRDSTRRTSKAHHEDHMTKLSLIATRANVAKSGIAQGVASKAESFELADVSRYPPSLFSDSNFQATCEGMAARDMKDFAGAIGFQMFYQGIYLVIIAVATCFLKLLGYCAGRDNDELDFGGGKVPPYNPHAAA
eukprot:TRINITY_DN4923_c0_g1_i6.p1 TRINITY_DN4923_c0_g1~~TRINITY_DN4923_c0_g1_i6.p1  ORF type:complete len:364 (+),score=53.22 TRINITY_DN4923_c0_g1_i6:81-1172(+)